MTVVNSKFIVQSVSKHADKNTYVTLVADTTGDNKEWSKYTPSGKIEMCITQDGANEAFAPGDKFDVQFTKQS